MPVNCPHCAKEIDKVVPEETLKARLAEKEGVINQLRPKAEAYDTTSTSLRSAQEEAAKLRGELGLRDALGGVGIHDAKAQRTIKAIYDAETAGVEEAKRPALGDWWKTEGATHPVLSAYAKTVTPAGSPPPPAGAPPAPGAPPPAPGAPPPAPPPPIPPGSPPGNAAKMTLEQLQAAMKSAEYLALKPAEARAKLAEWEKAMSAPASTGT